MSDISKQLMKNLKQIQKESSLNINELRIITALERVVARVQSSTELSEHIIFKGGFVLFKMYESSRFTRDIDAIGKNINYTKIKKLVPEVLTNNIDDGLWFGDISVQEILDEEEYGGLRFSLAFQIGDAPTQQKKIKNLSRIHFDIAVGDFIPDDLKKSQSKCLVDTNNLLQWKVYPPEYIFSEKIQTLVKRKEAMSRAKDIYDMIWLYSRCESRDAVILAIKNTFSNRETKLPNSWITFIEELSPELISKSWGSIQLMDKSMSFEITWSKLKDIFRELDVNA